MVKAADDIEGLLSDVTKGLVVPQKVKYALLHQKSLSTCPYVLGQSDPSSIFLTFFTSLPRAKKARVRLTNFKIEINTDRRL